MSVNKTPKIGVILGDHAGIGPEIAAKVLLAKKEQYIPVLIGNKDIFLKCCKQLGLNIPLSDGENFSGQDSVYFADIHAGSDIVPGKITKDSGNLMLESLKKGVELFKGGYVNALAMGPLTKQALHMSDAGYPSEFEAFASFFGKKIVNEVFKCDDFFRSIVVGHFRFTDIVRYLTTDSIVDTAHEMLRLIKMFGLKNKKIAVAALNPHAGEDGLFGDEEARIIQPAIDRLRAEGEEVIGPWPADTVILKAKSGDVSGIVYMFHDQGNIAVKSSYFGKAVLVYTNIDCPIVSVGHGSALDIAWQGKADKTNFELAIDSLLKIFKNNN